MVCVQNRVAKMLNTEAIGTIVLAGDCINDL